MNISEFIIDLVCDYYGVKYSELELKCNKSKLVKARHMIYTLLNKHTNQSLSEIGKLFHQHRTTVGSSLDTFKDYLDTDKALKYEFCAFDEKITKLIFPEKTLIETFNKWIKNSIY
jgi:chromosomal replication initiation ATPase DnaA